MRAEAVEAIVARGIPEDAIAAATWIDAQERGDRSNARVVDKLRWALPHQLSKEQRVEVVRAFCDEMSNGAPYIAALHYPSGDGDERNFHVHIVFRDRDPITGRRVMQTSERGSVERFRERTEHHINAGMENAGLDGRTDRRSHAARGINRTPRLHVGPAATNAARREARGGMTPAGRASTAAPLHSQARRVRNSIGAHSAERVVDYVLIDRGTRWEENVRRAVANARVARSEQQAALAARLAAARADMAAVGLGMMPGSYVASSTSRTASVSPRTAAAAAAAALMAEPMPFTLDIWEAEAIRAAEARQASREAKSAAFRASRRLAAAQVPRPIIQDTTAPLAREICAAAVRAAEERRAAELADARLAAAQVPRPIIQDTTAPHARQIRAAAVRAAEERRAAELADARLASAQAPRSIVHDTTASLARQIRAVAVRAAEERRAAELADARLAAAQASRPIVPDTTAVFARQIRAVAVRAAEERRRVETTFSQEDADRILHAAVDRTGSRLAKASVPSVHGGPEQRQMVRNTHPPAPEPTPVPLRLCYAPADLAQIFSEEPDLELLVGAIQNLRTKPELENMRLILGIQSLMRASYPSELLERAGNLVVAWATNAQVSYAAWLDRVPGLSSDMVATAKSLIPIRYKGPQRTATIEPIKRGHGYER